MDQPPKPLKYLQNSALPLHPMKVVCAFVRLCGISFLIASSSVSALSLEEFPQFLKDRIIPKLCPLQKKDWKNIPEKVGCFVERKFERKTASGKIVLESAITHASVYEHLFQPEVTRLHFFNDELIYPAIDRMLITESEAERFLIFNFIQNEVSWINSKPRVKRPRSGVLLMVEPSNGEDGSNDFGDSFLQTLNMRFLLRSAQAASRISGSKKTKERRVQPLLELMLSHYRAFRFRATPFENEGIRTNGIKKIWKNYSGWSFFSRGTEITDGIKHPKAAFNLTLGAVENLMQFYQELEKAESQTKSPRACKSTVSDLNGKIPSGSTIACGGLLWPASTSMSLKELKAQVLESMGGALLHFLYGPDRPDRNNWELPNLRAYLIPHGDFFWAYYGMNVVEEAGHEGSEWARCHYLFAAVRGLERILRNIKNTKAFKRDERFAHFSQMMKSYTKDGEPQAMGSARGSILYQMFLSATNTDVVKNKMQCPCRDGIRLKFTSGELNFLNGIFNLIRPRKNIEYCQ